MTYIINSYSGTPIASIPDKTINTTSTSLRLPGRNYPNYGEPVVENLVWLLENFAGAAPSGPTNPRVGQLWYDVANSVLKVYNGSAWVSAAPVQTTPVVPPAPPGPPPPGPPSPPGPADPVDGELLFDQSKKQLFVRGSNAWNLVGPIGAADGNDANSPVIPGFTSADAIYITDTNTAIHKVIRLTVGGQLVGVVSNDQSFTPAAIPTSPLQGFTTILPGINLNPTISNIRFNGRSTSTDVADNSNFLGGVSSGTYMRRDQTNLPTNDNLYNLGSASNRYAAIYANTFFGTATSAQTAATLAGLDPLLFARTDQNNVPTIDNSFSLGSNSARFATVFSRQFTAGVGPTNTPLFNFSGSTSTGFGNPATNMIGVYIAGTETARFVGRSLRLGDPTIDAGVTANPAIQTSFLSMVMNQANTDGITIRSTVSGPIFSPQPNTMLNLWGDYPINGATQRGISFRLNVSASALNLTAYEVGNISYDISGTAYNTISDYRRKRNIQPLSNALETISKITAKTFEFDGDTKRVTGFLAHEVQSVVANAVTGEKDAVDEKGSPVYQTMDHSKLVPLLWAAVQQLSEKIEALEAKLAT